MNGFSMEEIEFHNNIQYPKGYQIIKTDTNIEKQFYSDDYNLVITAHVYDCDLKQHHAIGIEIGAIHKYTSDPCDVFVSKNNPKDTFLNTQNDLLNQILKGIEEIKK